MIRDFEEPMFEMTVVPLKLSHKLRKAYSLILHTKSREKLSMAFAEHLMANFAEDGEVICSYQSDGWTNMW